MDLDNTMFFRGDLKEDAEIRDTLTHVYQALKDKGYDPVNQLVGYLISGDPAYITSHQNARAMMRKIERDDIVEALIKSYLKL